MLTVKLVYKLSDVPDDLIQWTTDTTYDTIYTHFQGHITNNIYGFGRLVFTCPNDGSLHKTMVFTGNAHAELLKMGQHFQLLQFSWKATFCTHHQ